MQMTETPTQREDRQQPDQPKNLKICCF